MRISTMVIDSCLDLLTKQECSISEVASFLLGALVTRMLTPVKEDQVEAKETEVAELRSEDQNTAKEEKTPERSFSNID
jgi:hypothetical protein